MHRWFRPAVRIGSALLLFALLVPIWPAGSVRAATIVVLNTNDSGSGSLRDAINQANAGPGGDTIAFNIPGNGAHRIAPTGPMPYEAKPMTIDATTQPGYIGVPLIELYGANAGGVAFIITGGGTTIKGFVLNSWPSAAISSVSNNNTIQGNYIGTDLSGTTAMPNGVGIIIGPPSSTTSATNNLIGGTTAAARNVISGNDNQGIVVNGNNGGDASNNVIAGNYIGINAAGTALVKHPTNLGSNATGIELAGVSNNLIGGTAPGSRNVISGGRIDNLDKGAGILINGHGRTAVGNVIEGNYLGTDATGTTVIMNNTSIYVATAKNTIIGGTTPAARNIIDGGNTAGIELEGSFPNPDGSSSTGNVIEGNYIGTDPTGTFAVPNQDGISITNASYNIVGGTAPGAGNLISGNTRAGVILEVVVDPANGVGANAANHHNTVEGNLIGTTVAGNARLGGTLGVTINAGTANIIGGATAAARNVIAGFSQQGIWMFNGATGNVAIGNAIGTDPTGTLDLDNGQGTGIYFDHASSNRVGGTAPGEGNMIAFCLRGVAVVTSSSDAVLGTAIYSSAADSINLALQGNNNQVAPTLTGAMSSGSNQIAVTGSLASAGAAPFHIEFFSTPNAASEGRTFLGSTSTAGGAFNASVAAPPSGQYITATATDANNNTSDFSLPQRYTAGPPAAVTANPGSTPQSAIAGNPFTAPLAVTVRDANGNPEGTGILVTFTAPTTGPSGTFSNGQTSIQARTDASGMTSVPFTSNLVGGAYQITATTPGTTSAVFALTNTPRPLPPPRPGSSQPGTPGTQPGSRPGPLVGGSPSPVPMPR
jgi:hypothetical protein